MNQSVQETAPTSDSGLKSARLREKLERMLGQTTILGLLHDPSVVEILLNPDGRIWVERQGQPMVPAGEMRESAATSVMNVVASGLNTTIDHRNPILECELPWDRKPRFEALVPPVVSGPTFTIRMKAERIFTLDDYVASGIMSTTQCEVIRHAVANHRNVLVAGGTGTGKTTLTNAIIREITDQYPHERICIIEDTGELQCAAKNAVIMRAVDGVSMTRLLKATMRLRPDRILVGEVRDGCALDLIKAWNTGHPGGVATVHSNTEEGAIAALMRMEELVAEVQVAPAQKRIAQAVNVVVMIERTAQGRRVRSVTQVRGYEGSDYQLEEMEQTA